MLLHTVKFAKFNNMPLVMLAKYEFKAFKRTNGYKPMRLDLCHNYESLKEISPA